MTFKKSVQIFIIQQYMLNIFSCLELWCMFYWNSFFGSSSKLFEEKKRKGKTRSSNN